MVIEAQMRLSKLLTKAPATSRAGHLRSLPELIGPPPQHTWEDEWVKLKAESYRLSGQGEATPEDDEAYVREHDPIHKYKNQEGVKQDIQHLVENGWSTERAEVYTLLFTCADALGRALRERERCYAASTYALSEALFAQRYGASLSELSEDARKPGAGRPRLPPRIARGTAPALYAHRDGLFGLCERDPAWNDVEAPDGTGFRGLTSTALVHASCDPRYFTADGFSVNTTVAGNEETFVLVPQDSDVVCFESNPDDEHGAHSAIITSESSGDFPPNTLFRLKGVVNPGQWEAPGGVFPMQRLLVVTATFQPPRTDLSRVDKGGSKMCGSSFALTYNDRSSFLHGLDDLIAMPSLSMQHEFLRDGPSSVWTDWKGVSYTSRAEWAYVNGPAARKEGCTPGTRDADNDGKTPQQFLDLCNAFIRQRRDSGLGTLLAADHAFLSLDEVLAVRLYSGPAYQPINTFLRQISSLTDAFRAQVAQHPLLSFAATVGHICRAIRKLAAVATPEEANARLWRGVRGELDKAFWFPDAQGMVCAVDMAFMSTSRKRQPPIDYMDGGGPNVLWQLYPKPESDSGFHRGASIEMLSQFAGEAEVLFPPCTMLAVKEDPKILAAKVAGDMERVKRLEAERGKHPTYGFFEVKEANEGDKTFLSIDVLPTFL